MACIKDTFILVYFFISLNMIYKIDLSDLYNNIATQLHNMITFDKRTDIETIAASGKELTKFMSLKFVKFQMIHQIQNEHPKSITIINPFTKKSIRLKFSQLLVGIYRIYPDIAMYKGTKLWYIKYRKHFIAYTISSRYTSVHIAGDGVIFIFDRMACFGLLYRFSDGAKHYFGKGIIIHTDFGMTTIPETEMVINLAPGGINLKDTDCRILIGKIFYKGSITICNNNEYILLKSLGMKHIVLDMKLRIIRVSDTRVDIDPISIFTDYASNGVFYYINTAEYKKYGIRTDVNTVLFNGFYIAREYERLVFMRYGSTRSPTLKSKPKPTKVGAKKSLNEPDIISEVESEFESYNSLVIDIIETKYYRHWINCDGEYVYIRLNLRNDDIIDMDYIYIYTIFGTFLKKITISSNNILAYPTLEGRNLSISEHHLVYSLDGVKTPNM